MAARDSGKLEILLRSGPSGRFFKKKLVGLLLSLFMNRTVVTILQRGSKTRVKLTLAITLASIIGISILSAGSIPFLPSVRAQQSATVSIDPSQVASLSYGPGTSISVQVNVANSEPYAGFQVWIFYNITILRFSGLDYSGNVFGNDLFVSSECQNGLAVQGSGNSCFIDPSYDGIGVVGLSLSSFSGYNTTAPNGKLFSLTFTVLASGFSPIHIVHQELDLPCVTPSQCPPGATYVVLNSLPHDGYFTNIACPVSTNALCLPPSISLSSPSKAIFGNAVMFDGSGSVSQNSNGVITRYNWAWRNGFDVAGQTTTSPTTTHRFFTLGLWTISLTVQDSYGAVAIETLPFTVIPNPLQITVSTFFTDQDLNPLPQAHAPNGISYPSVTLTFVNGIVRKSTPTHILAWFNITNSGTTPIQSLILNETIPPWILTSHNPSAAVQVFFANTGSLATNLAITQPFKVTVSSGNPSQWIQVELPDLNATEIGHPLLSGQSILVSVKLSNTIVGTSEPISLFPEVDLSFAYGFAWSGTQFAGVTNTGMNLSFLVVLAATRDHNASRPFDIV